MRATKVVSFLILSSLAAGSRSEERLPLSKSVGPRQAIASMGKDGRVIIRTTVIEFQNANLMVKEQSVSFDVGQLAISKVDGKPVDPKTLRDRLGKETAALVATDNQPVDPIHLRLIKDGTLVFVPRLPSLRIDQRYSHTIRFDVVDVSIPIRRPVCYLRVDGFVDDIEAHSERLRQEFGIITTFVFSSASLKSLNGATVPYHFTEGGYCAFVFAKKDKNEAVSAARLEHEKYH